MSVSTATAKAPKAAHDTSADGEKFAYDILSRFCSTSRTIPVYPHPRPLSLSYHPTDVPPSRREIDTVVLKVTQLRFHKDASADHGIRDAVTVTHVIRGVEQTAVFIIDWLTVPSVFDLHALADKYKDPLAGVGRPRKGAEDKRPAPAKAPAKRAKAPKACGRTSGSK